MNPELNNLIKTLSTFSDNGALDCIKIDHYSWPEDSIYRYFEKEFINKHLIKEVEIAVENEFLRWDSATAKKFVIDGLRWMRIDGNIPVHDACCDSHNFENLAIKTLKSLVQRYYDLEIIDILYKAKHLLQTAKQEENVLLKQIYERIIYELNECSLKEFAELKYAVLNGDHKS